MVQMTKYFLGLLIVLLSGCSSFQSQETREFRQGEIRQGGVTTGGQKQISPELREKIALEAQKAIHSEYPSESVTEPAGKQSSKYGKREGTKAGVKYVYEGGLHGDVFHGQGKLTYANGFSYEGGFKEGEYHGHGIAADSKRKWRYEGEFKEGRYEGKGSLTYSNGDRYEGEFRQGKRHGQGVLIKANGQRQAGQFVDNEFIAK